MNTESTIKLELEREFVPDACRHFVNKVPSVLHCHHYATLYCQLADDADLFDGRALLRKASEEALLPLMADIFERAGAKSVADRSHLVEEYWRFCGMGLLELEAVGRMSARARMDRSHVDEGWVRKWEKRDKPVNFIGQGFLAAALAAIYGAPAGSYDVRETESIVSGAPASRFIIVRA